MERALGYASNPGGCSNSGYLIPNVDNSVRQQERKGRDAWALNPLGIKSYTEWKKGDEIIFTSFYRKRKQKWNDFGAQRVIVLFWFFQ